MIDLVSHTEAYINDWLVRFIYKSSFKIVEEIKGNQKDNCLDPYLDNAN